MAETRNTEHDSMDTASADSGVSVEREEGETRKEPQPNRVQGLRTRNYVSPFLAEKNKIDAKFAELQCVWRDLEESRQLGKKLYRERSVDHTPRSRIRRKGEDYLDPGPLQVRESGLTPEFRAGVSKLLHLQRRLDENENEIHNNLDKEYRNVVFKAEHQDDPESRVQHKDLESGVQNKDLESNVQNQDSESRVRHQDVESRVKHQDLEPRVQHMDLEHRVQHDDSESRVQDLESRVQSKDLESNAQQTDLESREQRQFLVSGVQSELEHRGGIEDGSAHTNQEARDSKAPRPVSATDGVKLQKSTPITLTTQNLRPKSTESTLSTGAERLSQHQGSSAVVDPGKRPSPTPASTTLSPAGPRSASTPRAHLAARDTAPDTNKASGVVSASTQRAGQGDAAAPQRDTAPPQRDTAPPQRDTAPPQRDTAPPQRDTAPPQRKDATPTTRDVLLRHRDRSSPQTENKRKSFPGAVLESQGNKPEEAGQVGSPAKSKFVRHFVAEIESGNTAPGGKSKLDSAVVRKSIRRLRHAANVRKRLSAPELETLVADTVSRTPDPPGGSPSDAGTRTAGSEPKASTPARVYKIRRFRDSAELRKWASTPELPVESSEAPASVAERAKRFSNPAGVRTTSGLETGQVPRVSPALHVHYPSSPRTQSALLADKKTLTSAKQKSGLVTHSAEPRLVLQAHAPRLSQTPSDSDAERPTSSVRLSLDSSLSEDDTQKMTLPSDRRILVRQVSSEPAEGAEDRGGIPGMGTVPVAMETHPAKNRPGDQKMLSGVGANSAEKGFGPRLNTKSAASKSRTNQGVGTQSPRTNTGLSVGKSEVQPGERDGSPSGGGRREPRVKDDPSRHSFLETMRLFENLEKSSQKSFSTPSFSTPTFYERRKRSGKPERDEREGSHGDTPPAASNKHGKPAVRGKENAAGDPTKVVASKTEKTENSIPETEADSAQSKQTTGPALSAAERVAPTRAEPTAPPHSTTTARPEAKQQEIPRHPHQNRDKQTKVAVETETSGHETSVGAVVATRSSRSEETGTRLRSTVSAVRRRVERDTGAESTSTGRAMRINGYHEDSTRKTTHGKSEQEDAGSKGGKQDIVNSINGMARPTGSKVGDSATRSPKREDTAKTRESETDGGSAGRTAGIAKTVSSDLTHDVKEPSTKSTPGRISAQQGQSRMESHKDENRSGQSDMDLSGQKELKQFVDSLGVRPDVSDLEDKGQNETTHELVPAQGGGMRRIMRHASSKGKGQDLELVATPLQKSLLTTKKVIEHQLVGMVNERLESDNLVGALKRSMTKPTAKEKVTAAKREILEIIQSGTVQEPGGPRVYRVRIHMGSYCEDINYVQDGYTVVIEGSSPDTPVFTKEVKVEIPLQGLDIELLSVSSTGPAVEIRVPYLYTPPGEEGVVKEALDQYIYDEVSALKREYMQPWLETDTDGKESQAATVTEESPSAEVNHHATHTDVEKTQELRIQPEDETTDIAMSGLSSPRSPRGRKPPPVPKFSPPSLPNGTDIDSTLLNGNDDSLTRSHAKRARRHRRSASQCSNASSSDASVGSAGLAAGTGPARTHVNTNVNRNNNNSSDALKQQSGAASIQRQLEDDTTMAARSEAPGSAVAAGSGGSSAAGSTPVRAGGAAGPRARRHRSRSRNSAAGAGSVNGEVRGGSTGSMAAAVDQASDQTQNTIVNDGVKSVTTESVEGKEHLNRVRQDNQSDDTLEGTPPPPTGTPPPPTGTPPPPTGTPAEGTPAEGSPLKRVPPSTEGSQGTSASPLPFRDISAESEEQEQHSRLLSLSPEKPQSSPVNNSSAQQTALTEVQTHGGATGSADLEKEKPMLSHIKVTLGSQPEDEVYL